MAKSTEEELKPKKKLQTKIIFKKGGLHESTDTPDDKNIPAKKMAEAEKGKFGPKAEKQANFKKNVLTGPKKRSTSDGYMVKHKK